MIFIASFVPFARLNDVISAGILVAFSMTNSALLLLRHDPPPNKHIHNYGKDNNGEGNTVEWLVRMVNIFTFTFGITSTHL